ncbi:hypothetical protein E3P78_03740 [Wallemia ichthyophaga]|nr:hypothetical protein E3P78_03740 [Wallemia ichthyophaga]
MISSNLLTRLAILLLLQCLKCIYFTVETSSIYFHYFTNFLSLPHTPHSALSVNHLHLYSNVPQNSHAVLYFNPEPATHQRPDGIAKTCAPVVAIASNDYEIYASNGNIKLLFTLKDFDKATGRPEYYRKKEFLLSKSTLDKLDCFPFPSHQFMEECQEKRQENFSSCTSSWQGEIVSSVRGEITKDEALILEREQVHKKKVEVRKIADEIVDKLGPCMIILDELRPFRRRTTEYLNIFFLSNVAGVL